MSIKTVNGTVSSCYTLTPNMVDIIKKVKDITVECSGSFFGISMIFALLSILF